MASICFRDGRVETGREKQLKRTQRPLNYNN